MARILVVDDEPLVRSTLRQSLERAGHDVLEAEDGKGALVAYKAQRPDLVISDVLMPQTDGLTLLRELVELDPRIKVIAISGGERSGGTDYIAEARALGASSVAKPFRHAALLALVGQVLNPDIV